MKKPLSYGFNVRPIPPPAENKNAYNVGVFLLPSIKAGGAPRLFVFVNAIKFKDNFV